MNVREGAASAMTVVYGGTATEIGAGIDPFPVVMAGHDLADGENGHDAQCLAHSDPPGLDHRK